MRTRTNYTEYLTTRLRLLDWMIEVFEAFANRGTDEYTYFRAVSILDSMIEAQKVKQDNLHIYGVAAINIASKLLDYKPISINDCFEMIVHEEYSRKEILKRVNKTLNYLGFEFTEPTWLEYLDKLIYDVFGDHRDQLCVFNVRQVALFALHAMIMDVMFYSKQPKLIAAMALYYSVNAYYSDWMESNNGKRELALRMKQVLDNKKLIVKTICETIVIPETHLNAHMKELYGYLEAIREKIEEQYLEHLGKMFHINVKKDDG